MAVREFTTTDRVAFDDGGIGALNATAFSMFSLYKSANTTGGATRAHLNVANDASNIDIAAGGQDGGNMVWASTADFVSSFFGFDTTNYYVLGWSKASGNVTPRGHAGILGGTISHGNLSGALTMSSTVPDVIGVGQFFGSGGGDLIGRLAVQAIFLSELSDADFDNINSNATTAFLLTLSPFAAWEWNQGEVTADVLDLVGSCDQISRTGTTVVYNDDPAWEFNNSIMQTGAVQQFNADGAASGTLSTTLTVPTGTDFAIVGMASYDGDGFGGTGVTLTKGGVDTAMTESSFVPPAVGYMAALWYMHDPDVGTNKSLKFSFADATDEFKVFGVMFLKNVDSVRDSDGDNDGAWNVNALLTPSLTAQTGDKIIAWFATFTAGADDTLTSVTNLFILAQLTCPGGGNNGDAAWAYADPTGNVQVGAPAAAFGDDGSVNALVLVPAGEVVASDPTFDPMTKRLLFTGFRGR